MIQPGSGRFAKSLPGPTTNQKGLTVTDEKTTDTMTVQEAGAIISAVLTKGPEDATEAEKREMGIAFTCLLVTGVTALTRIADALERD